MRINPAVPVRPMMTTGIQKLGQGPGRRRVLRREEPANGERRVHHDGEHDDQRQEKAGRRHPDKSDKAENVVANRILVGRTVNPDGDGHNILKDQRRQRQDQRGWQPVLKDLDHRPLVQVKGDSHVPSQKAAGPAYILLPCRLVEAVPDSQLLHHQFGVRISLRFQLRNPNIQVVNGGELDNRKADDGDHEQERDRRENAASHEDDHATAPPPSPVIRSYA
jgi:hypothetical protein